MLSFEWDDGKAASNWRKHGVTFEEAASVFEDPLAAIFEDEAHSWGSDARSSWVTPRGVAFCSWSLLSEVR